MPDRIRTILVAEDDADVRELVRTELRACGYDVHCARTGREALERIAALRVDGMVLDINMPELDGFGVLEGLRGTSSANLPVLVLTARHAGEDVQRALNLGAKDYLTKPFSRNQLLARIKRLLRAPLPSAPADSVFFV